MLNDIEGFETSIDVYMGLSEFLDIFGITRPE